MPRKNRSAGDYGREHRRVREALLPYAVGQDCTRCKKPILPGEKVDLDHKDDRTGYEGWAHQACNRRAGAEKGNRRFRPTTSRDW